LKLKLISPKKPAIENHREHWDGRFTSFLFGVKKYTSTYLALPTLAGLTPSDVETEIIDENIEDINFEDNTDLVGITAPTFLATRAYEIADEFRKIGVRVILGGIHPSILPDEAIQHADSVVIGEAENVWADVINDCKTGKLKKFYSSQGKSDLENQPIPRWDLLKNNFYSYHVLQTSRGCPYDCEFCSVKSFLGNKYRYKSVDKVIKEVETLLNIEKKGFFFVDDNFIANKKRTKEILKRLLPYKIYYYCQATTNIAEDDELLELLAKSGCRNVFLGFESISKVAIENMNKSFSNNIDDYAKNIEKIQSYGIGILGSFIFGNDTDNESVFENTAKFINQTNIESVVFHILTPFPGTKLYNRLEQENRILHRNWEKYDATFVCFKPKLMSPDILQNGYIRAYKEVYSYENAFKRVKGLLELWNKNNVRLWDRISPIVINLSGNDRASTYRLPSL